MARAMVPRGDRENSDARAPALRDRSGVLARRAIYRGFARVRGCTSQSQQVVAFLHPSPTHPHFADGLTCEFFRNLVRLRAGTHVRCGSFNRVAADGVSRTLTIESKVADRAQDVVLPHWTTADADALRCTSEGNAAAVELADHHVGAAMPVHVGVALRYNACVTLTRPADAPPGVGPLADIQLPTEQLVFDVHIHPDLFRGQTPRLVIRDTAAERTVPKTRNYRTESCAFATDCHFVPLAPARTAHELLPDYSQLLDDVAAGTGWAVDRFRAFRATVRYPIYGSIVHAYFDREIVPTPR